MKNIIFIALILPFTLINAQVQFEKDIQEAFKKAKASQKIVFVEYYNSDCSVCKKLEPLFKDEKMGNFYNANFVNYKMNTRDGLTPAEENVINQAGLHFESVPFFLFFDANTKKLLHYSGTKQDVNHLITIGQTALNPKERTANLAHKYQAGDRSVRTLYAYASLLHLYKDEDKIIQVTQNLFDSFSKAELPTRKSYTVLKNVIIDTENGFFQYWISNLDKLKGMEEGANEGRETEVLEKIVLKALASPDVKQWPASKKNKFKTWIKTLGITDNPDVFFE